MPSKSLSPKPRSIASKRTISIIASLYNEDLVNSLLNSTVDELRRIIPGININVYRVPGAFEIPVCAKKLIDYNDVDTLIALGVIIKGETAHAELVAQSVTQSLQEIATESKTPWSAPEQRTYVIGDAAIDANNLVVSEIMYRPSQETDEEELAGFTDRDQVENQL